jgi:hypothetical protein
MVHGYEHSLDAIDTSFDLDFSIVTERPIEKLGIYDPGCSPSQY